jgi:hypothetical protein
MKKRRCLTPEEVVEIRSYPRMPTGRHAPPNNPYSLKALAAKYGVSESAISDARTGATWSDDMLDARRKSAKRALRKPRSPAVAPTDPPPRADEIRDIPGYDGRYSVTADGRIWRHERRWMAGRKRASPSHFPSTWQKPRLRYGYLRVELGGDGGIRFSMAVHRAVALAWIPNPDGLEQVNHKNGVKTDNRVENLEWVTRSQNGKHAWATGLSRSTERHREAARRRAPAVAEALSKLSLEQQREVACAYAAGGKRLIDLAAEYGVSITPIRRAIRLHSNSETERSTNNPAALNRSGEP